MQNPSANVTSIRQCSITPPPPLPPHPNAVPWLSVPSPRHRLCRATHIRHRPRCFQRFGMPYTMIAPWLGVGDNLTSWVQPLTDEYKSYLRLLLCCAVRCVPALYGRESLILSYDYGHAWHEYPPPPRPLPSLAELESIPYRVTALGLDGGGLPRSELVLRNISCLKRSFMLLPPATEYFSIDKVPLGGRVEIVHT